jgi:propanol-preferring alcohol dehydrogenase
MAAWAVTEPGPIDGEPLRATRLPRPEPGPGELLVEVTACGVCRTDLHVVEGDLPVHRSHVVPGHEVVGRVLDAGAAAGRTGPFRPGDRVGVPWLRSTCGRCRFCTSGRENLCLAPSFTGWDADGGYAELVTVPAAFAYPIPDAFDDVHAAPLLCAGIIGYRALERASLPPGGRLGIYGFGGSAHLTAQIALHRGATVHVLTRSAAARQLALDLGCASAAGAADEPPEPLDAAIVFAPVGDLVPVALAAVDRGGTVAVAGIHLSDIPTLDYQRHLFQERQLRSVTANTRIDGRRFLAEAQQAAVHVTAQPYAFDRAIDALRDLKHDRVDGAAVLVTGA